MYMAECLNFEQNKVILKDDQDDEDFVTTDIVAFVDEDGNEVSRDYSTGLIFGMDDGFYIIEFSEFEQPTFH